jgi:hypothetical protein
MDLRTDAVFLRTNMSQPTVALVRFIISQWKLRTDAMPFLLRDV